MALRIAHGAKGAGDHVTLSVGVASHIPGEADGTPTRCRAWPARRFMRQNGLAATACRFLAALPANQPRRTRRKRLPAPRQSA